jgi:hypothetical protein
MKFESIQSVKTLKISEMSKIKGGNSTKSVYGAHGGQTDSVDANGNVTWPNGDKGKIV